MKTNSHYLKAVRKANREIELENENGWVSVNKNHKMKTDYKRMKKYKNYLFEEE
jgi:hypothetical protein